MEYSFLRKGGTGLLVMLALLGTGCTKSISNLTSNVQDTVGEAAAGQMTETEYYNLVIRHMNSISNNVEIMAERVQAASVETDPAMKATNYYQYDYIANKMTQDARTEILEANISMENAEAQQAIAAKLDPYFTKVNEAGDVYSQLADYSEREQYKDDSGAKYTELEPTLTPKVEEIITLQNEIFDLVEQYQEGVDLGIDENTSDPLEVIVLAQETLSDDVEAAHTAYSTWAEAYVGGTTNGTEEMQKTFDTLSADYDKYKAKLDEVKAADALNIDIHLTGYLDAVDAYSVTYEKVIRDISNNELAEIATTDEELATQYEDVINEHNSLVTDVNSASMMP